MTRDEAERLLGLLIGGTGGWNTAPDETLVFYTRAIAQFRDVDAAAAAVHDVCMTWTEARRPPIAEINRAYSAQMRRRSLEAVPELLPGPVGRIVPVEVGRQIAARAYADECARRDSDDPLVLRGFRSHQPSARHLAAILGSQHRGDQ